MKKFAISLLAVLAIASHLAARPNPYAFGEKQLDRMLADRPSMRDVLSSDDPIHQLVVKRFTIGDRGQPVYWDPDNPFSGRPAEHNSTSFLGKASLRITNAEEIQGRDKWCMLVFELANLENAAQFESLDRSAFLGNISEKDYSVQCVQLELDAVERMQAIFRQHPLPDANSESAPIYQAMMTMSSELDSYLAFLDSRDRSLYDPRRYFGKRYRSLRPKPVQRSVGGRKRPPGGTDRQAVQTDFVSHETIVEENGEGVSDRDRRRNSDWAAQQLAAHGDF